VVEVVRVEWIRSVARIAIKGTVLPQRKTTGAIAIREPRRQAEVVQEFEDRLGGSRSKLRRRHS
jgi:hypothetical protein